MSTFPWVHGPRYAISKLHVNLPLGAWPKQCSFEAACRPSLGVRGGPRSSSSGSARGGAGAGGHHRVGALGEELRWLAVHGQLLIPICNLNEGRLIEGACTDLESGRSSQGCVKTLQPMVEGLREVLTVILQ